MTKKQIVQSGLDMEGWSSKEKLDLMVDLILERKPKKLLEIGLYFGRSFFPIYWAAQEYGGAEVYGIDPFDPNASLEGMEGAHHAAWGSIDHDVIYQTFMDEVAELPSKPDIRIARSREVEDFVEVGFLHIDGNHSINEALKDVQFWVPKMAKGGVIVFDDVDWPTTKNAVDFLGEKCKLLHTVTSTNVVNYYDPRDVAGDTVRAYNPTLAEVNGKIWLVFRYECGSFYNTSLGRVELDRDSLRPIAPMQDLRMIHASPKVTTMDDPRHIRFKNQNYLLVCQGGQYQDYRWCGSITLCNIDVLNFQTRNMVTPSYGRNINWLQTGRLDDIGCEKNWSYFDQYGDEMLFAYTLEPLVMIRVNPQNGLSTHHSQVAWKEQNTFKRFLGGGTVFFDWDDTQKATFFHTFRSRNGQRVYDSGVLLVDRGSLKPTWMSKGPLVRSWNDPEKDLRYRLSHEVESKYRPVVYWPSGVIVRRSEIVVSFGWNDSHCGISYFDRKDIENSLVKINV